MKQVARPSLPGILMGFLIAGLLMATSCQKEEEVAIDPAISGTYDGPSSVVTTLGIRKMSNIERITVNQISDSSLTIAGAGFETFTISPFKKGQKLANGSWIYSVKGEDNHFCYSISENYRPSLQFDWVKEITGGKQRVQFGGYKNKL